MPLGNLNTADFIKGANVSQDGNIITIEQPVNTNLSGFNGLAYAVWSGSGLVFNVYAPSYYIAGILYPSFTDSVTLDAADGTYDRFDTIGVDASGVIKITGTAEANPVVPTVDTLTQLAITTILIESGATTPTQITEEDVYKENVEWTGNSDTTSPTFDNTNDPFAGTYHVNINGFTANQYVKFTDVSTHNIYDYYYLKFYISLKGTFASTAGFIISFRNGSTLISSEFTVTNGVYNFDRTDTTGYQLIVIPLNEFTFSSSTFDTVYFKLKGSNSNGFKLDNIVLQAGVVVVNTGGGIVNSIVAGTNITVDNTDPANPIVSSTGGSGTPGGSDTQVQFNDGGSFGGDAGMTYNKTTNTLTVEEIVNDMVELSYTQSMYLSTR